MKKIQHCISVLLAVIFLAGTSGIPIYKHRCNTNNTTGISVFIPTATCNMPAPKADKNSCCLANTDSNPKTSNSQIAESSCCTDNTTVAKLDTGIILTGIVPQIKPAEKPAFAIQAICPTLLFESIQIRKNEYLLQASSPPGTTSKHLALLQVYLI